MRDAFTFLIATAWVEFYDSVFVMVAGDSTHILMQLLRAFILTLLAVMVTMLFESDYEGHED